jgi:hypothetical protein
MPFKSQAQHRKFRELLANGKITQAKFDEWLGATPDLKKLPERVGEKSPDQPVSGHAADQVILHGRKKR